MKLLFTTQGTEWDSPMDSRFGRAPYLFVYDEETEETLTLDNSTVENMACSGMSATKESGALAVITMDVQSVSPASRQFTRRESASRAAPLWALMNAVTR